MDISLELAFETALQQYEPNCVRLGVEPHDERFGRREFREGDVAESFHEYTKAVAGGKLATLRDRGRFAEPSMAFAAGASRPDYRNRERIALPAPDESLDAELGTVLQDRRSPPSYDGSSLSLDRFATLLGHAFGPTRRGETGEGGKDGEGGEGDVAVRRRAYPSAGALYPVEPYVGVRNVDGVASGAYYYRPEAHALRRLDEDSSASDSLDDSTSDPVADCFPKDAPGVEGAAAVVFLTAALARPKAKYGARGYRYALQESGHVAQTLHLVAVALGLASRPLGGFDDRAVEAYLGVDGVDEVPIYAVSVGRAGEDRD